jgi:hypothetical protein
MGSMSTAKPLRWRKAKRDRPFSRTEIHELHRGDEILAMCQSLEDGRWFWYGDDMNTANSPVATLDTAKTQARNHIVAKGL